MESKLGSLLKELRTTGHWSVRGLAAQAGISKSTLSDWETGKKLPRLPELEAALRALGASAAQRRRCLGLLDAPRAVRLLRTEIQGETDASESGPAPIRNGLLRAMRLRRRRGLEEVARHLGVQASTISRWERGESWPTTEHLHSLCYLLQAHPEELFALTREKVAAVEPTADVSEDDLHAVLTRLVFYNHDPHQEALKDLRFLTLIEHIWTDASRRKAEADWLIPVYARYGQFLVERGRFREAQHYTDLAFERRRGALSPDPYWLCAGNMAAKISVYSRPHPDPKSGVRLMRGWLDYLNAIPEAQPADMAWVMSDLAEYLALDGASDAALDLSRRAYLTTQEYDSDGNDVRHRQRELAQMYLRIGRAEEGLQTLQAGGRRGMPVVRLQEAITETELHLALGERSDAHACLQRALAVLEQYALPHHRSRVDALTLKMSDAL